MKWHSFRLRIALLSATLAGSAIICFGLVSWLLIYKTKVARLDSEIKSQLLRESSPPRPRNHWPSYQSALPSFFGLNSQNAIALLVLDIDGNTLFSSNNWPADLDQSQLFPQLPFSLPLFPPPREEPPHLSHHRLEIVRNFPQNGPRKDHLFTHRCRNYWENRQNLNQLGQISREVSYLPSLNIILHQEFGELGESHPLLLKSPSRSILLELIAK